MTNEELNRKIAEVKGYRFSDPRFGDIVLPNWSIDIKAAWELLNEMTEELSRPGPMGGLRNCTIQLTIHKTQHIQDYLPGGYPRSTKYDYHVVVSSQRWSGSGSGATAPEAICKAYLAWKEGQHE